MFGLLPFFFFFLPHPFFLCFCLRRISPCNATVQICKQMLSGGCELIAIQSKPEQPGAKRVFFIGGLCFLTAGTVLVECLSTNRQTKLDVRFDLSCMERPVKQAKLHRSFLKNRMKIQTVIPAVIIMLVAAAWSVIPDPFHVLHGSRTPTIEFFQKSLIHRPAPAVLAIYRYIQCFID